MKISDAVIDVDGLMSPLGCHKADSPLPANQIRTLHRADALCDQVMADPFIHLHTTAKLEDSDLGLHNITSLLNILSGDHQVYQAAYDKLTRVLSCSLTWILWDCKLPSMKSDVYMVCWCYQLPITGQLRIFYWIITQPWIWHTVKPLIWIAPNPKT